MQDAIEETLYANKVRAELRDPIDYWRARKRLRLQRLRLHRSRLQSVPPARLSDTASSARARPPHAGRPRFLGSRARVCVRGASAPRAVLLVWRQTDTCRSSSATHATAPTRAAAAHRAPPASHWHRHRRCEGSSSRVAVPLSRAHCSHVQPYPRPLPPRASHHDADERSCKVYNYACQADAPLYLTVGDGGNREGLASSWCVRARAAAA